MAQSKSVSSWRLMIIEHGRQRREFEELMRAEREHLLLRHKEEFNALKKSQDKSLHDLKRRLLDEENAERENRSLPKKTVKRKRDEEDAPLENISLTNRNIVRIIFYLNNVCQVVESRSNYICFNRRSIFLSVCVSRKTIRLRH